MQVSSLNEFKKIYMVFQCRVHSTVHTSFISFKTKSFKTKYFKSKVRYGKIVKC